MDSNEQPRLRTSCLDQVPPFPSIHCSVNTSLILLSVPDWDGVLRNRAQCCMKTLLTRYSFCHLPFLLWFALLLSDFLSVILRKGVGGAGAGSSVLIVKANISPSSPGDRSVPHVSGDTAAFHSDVNQDKAKCFLQIHRGGQLADSPILFTLLFFCLFCMGLGLIRQATQAVSPSVDLLLQGPGAPGPQTVVCQELWVSAVAALAELKTALLL